VSIPRKTIREYAASIGRSPSTARRRAASLEGATKVRGRWQIPTEAVMRGYANQADSYWQSKQQIPLSAHAPVERHPWGYSYQFAVRVRLTFEDGSIEIVEGYSYTIAYEPEDRLPSYRKLRRDLIDALKKQFLEGDDEWETPENDSDPVERAISLRLLASTVVQARRRT
jgi:hypothetical protein